MRLLAAKNFILPEGYEVHDRKVADFSECLGRLTLMNFITAKAPASRVATAARPLELRDTPLRVFLACKNSPIVLEEA